MWKVLGYCTQELQFRYAYKVLRPTANEAASTGVVAKGAAEQTAIVLVILPLLVLFTSSDR